MTLSVPIPTITMPKEKAREEWKKYCNLVKKSANQHIKDMKNALYQLSKGKELIDIYLIFKNVALEDDMPKLAIVRADAEMCYLERRDNGAGCFWHKKFNRNSGKGGKIALPSGTYAWQTRTGRIWNERFKTVPPSIPAHVYPDSALHNYFILWEVEKGAWAKDAYIPPADPYLLKRITKNLFVPLASWDLTELERSILIGGVGPEE